MKNNLSKEEAMEEYLSKRREKDEKNGFIHSIIQVVAANFIFVILICGVIYSNQFDFGFLFMTAISGLFALGLDWAFYDTYIKKDINKNDKKIVKTEEKVFCTNCGKEVKGTWKHCKFCGNNLE